MFLVFVHGDELQRADFAMITVGVSIHSHSVVDAVRMEAINVTFQLEPRQNVLQTNRTLKVLALHVANLAMLVKLRVADESLAAMFADLWTFS